MALTPSNSLAHVYLWYANMGYFKRMSTAPILLLFLYFWGRGAFPPCAARRTCLPAKNSVWLTLKAFIRVCLYIYCLILFLWRETGGVWQWLINVFGFPLACLAQAAWQVSLVHPSSSQRPWRKPRWDCWLASNHWRTLLPSWIQSSNLLQPNIPLQGKPRRVWLLSLTQQEGSVFTLQSGDTGLRCNGPLPCPRSSGSLEYWVRWIKGGSKNDGPQVSD